MRRNWFKNTNLIILSEFYHKRLLSDYPVFY